MRKRPWLRKLSVVGIILAILSPLVGFGLSNLYLISPKGRFFLERKISSLTGLDASLQGATWSPWNGITFYGIRVEQPTPLQEKIASPLLLVESVRVHPVWSALRSRRLLVKSIEIQRPELCFPVEILSQIPSQDPLPQLASNDQNIPGPPPQHHAPPDPGSGIATQIEPAKPTESIPAKVPTIESVSEEPSPVTWVSFSGARIGIVSTFTEKTIYEVSGIRGALPIGGSPADSTVRIGPVKCFENPLSEEMKIPIHSRGNLLTTDTIQMSFSGIDCKLAAAISLTKGLPFQITTSIPEQNDKKFKLSPAIGIQAKTIAGQGLFQGLARSPGTWQGQWILQALAVSGEYESHKAEFESGRALVVFGNGALRCLDARMVGDDTSFLGNATLLKDGRFAGIARVVSAPDSLVAISKFYRPDQSAPHLTPLTTPQRSALDLQLFGTLGNLFFKPDSRTKAIPLNEILSLD